jgi:hypothetical protein
MTAPLQRNCPEHGYHWHRTAQRPRTSKIFSSHGGQETPSRHTGDEGDTPGWMRILTQVHTSIEHEICTGDRTRMTIACKMPDTIDQRG